MPEVFLPRDWPEDAPPVAHGAQVTRAPGPTDAVPTVRATTEVTGLPPIAGSPDDLGPVTPAGAAAPAPFWKDAERAERRGRRRRRGLGLLLAFGFMLTGLHLGGIVVWEAIEHGPEWSFGDTTGSAAILHPDERPVEGQPAILRRGTSQDFLGVVERIEGDEVRLRSGDAWLEGEIGDTRRVVVVVPWLGWPVLLVGRAQ